MLADLNLAEQNLAKEIGPLRGPLTVFKVTITANPLTKS